MDKADNIDKTINNNTNIKEADLPEIVQLLKQCLKNPSKRKPVFLIGAGFSKTGGIPLANEICNEIQAKYGYISGVKKQTNPTYTKLMECLSDDERKTLIKKYIESSFINVSHIYLAALYEKGLIDYILTTNFDDLLLRALSICNIFPPTYDLTLIRKEDVGTSHFEKGSIFYLHGQRHGIYHLNTAGQMNRVKKIVREVFTQIKCRPWIVIGYSGNDPILERLCELKKFSDKLYWINYMKNELDKQIYDFLRKIEGTCLVNGYDADSFMYKLYKNVNKQKDFDFEPFRQKWLEYINSVETTVRQFSSEEYIQLISKEKEIIDNLSIELTQIIISGRYDEKKEDIDKITKLILNSKNKVLIERLSNFYTNWGLNYSREDNEESFYLAYKKFEKAIEIKSDYYDAYYEWGVCLYKHFNLKEKKREELLEEAIKKFQEAIKYNSDFYLAYQYYGFALDKFSKLKTGKEKEQLEREAQEMFAKAQEVYDRTLKEKQNTSGDKTT